MHRKFWIRLYPSTWGDGAELKTRVPLHVVEDFWKGTDLLRDYVWRR